MTDAECRVILDIIIIVVYLGVSIWLIVRK